MGLVGYLMGVRRPPELLAAVLWLIHSNMHAFGLYGLWVFLGCGGVLATAIFPIVSI